MQKDIIKVVWICEFSNKQIREKLHFEKYSLLLFIRKLFHKPNNIVDFGEWNTNAIKEFEKFENIELHIISHHLFLKQKVENFVLNNINYHFFKPEGNSLFSILKRKFYPNSKTTYKNNALITNKIINNIQPDIVHLIGAENPHYSSSVLSLDNKYPLIVTLQTLMSDPNFLSNYPISKELYEYRSNIEKEVIKRADYIGTSIENYAKKIRQYITKDATFVICKLALGEAIHNDKTTKKYDFVYFSKDIEKAGDWAIKAFILAHKNNPKITLLIIGRYTQKFKEELDKLIIENKIEPNVTFTGSLPTHDDVINKIKEAKFALLPLKIDLISGTIREAMACGLPVITTRTEGTPNLNIKRECILISEPNDFQDMANKMQCLMNNSQYADTLRNNSLTTINERYNNTLAMQGWVDAYKAILKHYHHNTPIPTHLLLNI